MTHEKEHGNLWLTIGTLRHRLAVVEERLAATIARLGETEERIERYHATEGEWRDG